MVRGLALLGITGLALAGCANQPPLVDRVSKGQVQGDAGRVSIEGGRIDALPLAVIHCARYGRSARWSHTDGDRSVYDCVAKP
ncbi:hypothetical protein [Caulobacter sp. S45]|uniref:hypothetical protein n=1 Tax=Caulobacter sp. S45 TaxID=1641861 RepID=UPI0015760331|nr:hypothetical protein [Caulobacter sp. S45]